MFYIMLSDHDLPSPSLFQILPTSPLTQIHIPSFFLFHWETSCQPKPTNQPNKQSKIGQNRQF